MRKAGILILTLVLVSAMFCGCRRQPDTTNTTTAPGTTQSTGKVTTPGTTGSTKPSTGMIPDGTTVMPQPTDGSQATRGHRGPRY